MGADLYGALDRADPLRWILHEEPLHDVDALVGQFLLRLNLVHVDRVAHDIFEQLVLIVCIVGRQASDHFK